MRIAELNKKIFTKKIDEKILVISQKILFGKTAPQGLIAGNPEEYFSLIQNHKQFLWRSEMEVDESYKQIIPLFVFMHEDKIFLMQRSKKAGDARLQSMYTVGIGGHVREEDLKEASIQSWVLREFEEEVDYCGTLKIEPIGMINDDSNAVGRVHAGFIFLAHGSDDAISIKSELQSGKLVSLEDALSKGDKLESWTRMIIEHLLDTNNN